MKTPLKRRGVQVTSKQQAIMKLLLKRNPDGSLLDVYQLIEQYNPGETRGAMKCTIIHLAAHGLLAEGDKQSRRKRSVRTYYLTQLGVSIIRTRNVNPIVPQKVVTP